MVGADPLSDLAVLRADERRAGAGRARRRGAAARRPAGGRDRQPVRLRRVGDGRRRVGARPLAADADGAAGAPDRQRDPDRCRTQPRQLGRRARRQRAARVVGINTAVAGVGLGLAVPIERRHAAGDRRADPRRARPPRLPRDRARRAAAAAAARPPARPARLHRGGGGRRRAAPPTARGSAPAT